MERIVIVGASAAGIVAAETLRREGFPGVITMIGEETSPPYDRPPLSKQILSSDWDADRLLLRTPEQFAGLDLDLHLSTRATALDTQNRVVRTAAGPALGYDALIIATGVRPRKLPGHPAHVLRTVDDALRLRERLIPGCRLVVVGAGFLGAEATAVARSLGCEVTLLEPAPVPLAHAVSEPIGRILSEAHREHGVDLRTGVSVAAVTAQGVTLSDGTTIEADEVLVAIGSHPNTEWLQGSGLTLTDGILCDQYCAAIPAALTDPASPAAASPAGGVVDLAVYAAGDVARWYNPLFGVTMRIEHRTNAAEQGMAAARNLLHPGAGKPFTPVPYFWSDQYDMKIHAYGYLRDHDQVEIVDGSLADRRFLAVYRKNDRLVGALAVGMPPKALRPWRQHIASAATWTDAVPMSVSPGASTSVPVSGSPTASSGPPVSPVDTLVKESS
ncbi:NAD(P)/FAD-dependent oxidoreductase [Actinoplanes derwentensis]|uniref:NAD(P)/FAD-dependent oxidoreductase n=1 Tax=Actinoplanes derwentensis TaxID=113562 RepID=UPI000B853F73|nr:FAD/NAD(P)-binding oxidoreductase [Actinoplanes derwentensis]GID81370.1 pyridine nucleotide-disulfide oxidoreductase [Actinoplanes derwentensis]